MRLCLAEVRGANLLGSAKKIPRVLSILGSSARSEFEGDRGRGPCEMQKVRGCPSHECELFGLKTCGFLFVRYYIN